MSPKLRVLLQECHDALCAHRPDLAVRLGDVMYAAEDEAQVERAELVTPEVAQRAFARRLRELEQEVGS
jgi:hypothetical protein